MSLFEKASHLLGEEQDGTSASLWPILGPFFILCVGVLSPRDPLMLCLSLIGLFVSARWQIRGFSYSLVLLGLVCLLEHGWLTSHHLWQLGLEGFCAIAFFITALASEERGRLWQSLSDLLTARQSSMSHLEEEMEKIRASAAESQMALQDKIALLQKELEEAQGETTSLLVLNEVLRKTTAMHGAKKEEMHNALLDAQAKMTCLQNELDEMCKVPARSMESQELAGRLNATRLEVEQAHLMHEAAIREHQVRHAALQAESKALQDHLKQINVEREQYRLMLQKLEEVQAERNALHKRLEQAEVELSIKPQKPMEPLYKQLRAQFEEKNEMLHRTRAELFHTDTQLQALKIEKEQGGWIIDPLTEAMQKEIAAYEDEIARLEHENLALEYLITMFHQGIVAAPQSKVQLEF